MGKVAAVRLLGLQYVWEGHGMCPEGVIWGLESRAVKVGAQILSPFPPIGVGVVAIYRTKFIMASFSLLLLSSPLCHLLSSKIDQLFSH